MTALTAAGVLALGGVAVADNIQDTIEGTGVVTLVAGSTTGGTAGVRVVGNNSDGPTNDPNCNWDAGENPLTLDVITPAGVTATPNPLSIYQCGNPGVTVTFTASSQAVSGVATVSIVSTPAGGGGYTNQVSIPITVNQPANTEPTVVVAGVTDGANYDKGSVPAATCEVTDAEDGPQTFPAALSGTLDSDGLGSQTASCSYTDAGLLTASASETYSIVDSSAPVITYTLSPATADGSDWWYRGNVLLTWNVSEPQSPNSLQKTGCVDQTVSADQFSTLYSCSATSSGGSSGPVNVGIKRDGNGPSVSYTSAAGTLGNDDWYVSPVTATFTATDGFSGVAGSGTATTTSTTNGAAVVLDSPAFSDNAGNTTTAGDATSPAFKIDTVPPSVGDAVLSGDMGQNDWYTSAVTASFTGTDATSGVAGDNPKTASTGGAQGESTLLSPEFRDVAGNTAVAGVKRSTVKVDSVAPSVALVDGPADGGSYYFGSVPPTPTCTASDATSGLSGACSISSYGTSVGNHTVVATAIDLAGNVSTSERDYTVLAWETKGYYSPVDMGWVWNSVKGGATVPLKFEVFAGSSEFTSTSVVTSFVSRAVACPGSSAFVDPIETVLTGGTSLRYDTTGGQFIQNWQTPKKPGTCAQAITTMQDGSSITANFVFK